MPGRESPTSTNDTWTILNPKRCSFVAFGPPLVSTFVDLCFVLRASVVESGASAIAGCGSDPWDVVSVFSFAEKQSFLRWGGLAPTRMDRRTTVILV